ncbi:MAG: hypothetical protein ACRC7H_09545 [Plesiomonas shigelloides]
MLHMEVKSKIIFIWMLLTTCLFAGNQNVDISLNLTYPGASQQIINDKLVIDLGFLKEGGNYTGNNQIKIGTVKVNISQSLSNNNEDPCILEDIEYNSVNINKLKTYSERISSKDRFYIGEQNGIILTAKNINGVITEGNLAPEEEEYLFVAPECIDPGMDGFALKRLQYEFDLYADISGVLSVGTVVGAFAEDDKGVAISIKELISSQIRNSLTIRGKRRK